MSGLIWPKIKFDQAFMSVLVPATLMMIRSKMNELAWRHNIPIISLWEIFQTLKGSLLCSQWSDLAEIRTRSRFYACPHYLQV